MAKWGDILTGTEKTELKRLIDIGIISDTNIDQFADRFLRAPQRETAFQQALDTSIGAAVARDWHGIKRGFKDPMIGVEAARQHYAEKGVVKGTADIAWSAITTPVRSWAEILGGEPGLGENPLETLVGAASVIPVGRAAAGVTSASLRSMAKGALRSGNFSRAQQLIRAANQSGRITQSRVWRPTARAIEAGDIVTGIEEWPLELIGEGVLEAGAALGGAGFNRLGSQESIVDSIVNTARQIQTDDAIEDKINQATQIIGDPVLQRIIDENPEDVEDMEAARDLLEVNALLRYIEQETTQEEDANAEARTESEAHDEITGSNTAPPRPWHELQEETAAAERALQDATERARAAEAEAVDTAGPRLAADTERARQQMQETERAAHAAVVEADREGFGAFRNEYIQLYDQLTGGDAERTRDMMYADFANEVNPTEVLEEGIFSEETEGININENSVAVARQRTHRRLREMLGDTLYERYYGEGAAQRPSVDDRVRAADQLTDELVEGEETQTTETEDTEGGGGDPDGSDAGTGTGKGEVSGTEADRGDEPSEEETQPAEPLPEDLEGRAAADAAREQMPEVVGNEDIIRWQRKDGTWEETRVVYKLIERAAAIASHRFRPDQVSLERNPIYNWALGIQGRTDARLEEIQDRLRPDEFNAYQLAERTQGMTRGTPTLLPSYDAAAGNHRLMMFELMYARDGQAKAEYLAMLNEVLPDFGIDPGMLQAAPNAAGELMLFQEPILIRQVVGEVSDVKDFAEASNREDAAPRTTEHQALEDAESLTIERFDKFNFGEIGGSNRKTIAQMLSNPSRENLRALVAFVEALPPQARSRYRRGNSKRLAAEARVLFENVVLAKTFTSERGNLLFQEMTDGTLEPGQNARAVLMALPHLAKFDAYLQDYNPDVQALSLSDDVAAAVHQLSTLRSEPNNLTIGQVGAYLDSLKLEEDPTLTPEAHAIMKAIYATKDAGPIANILINTIGQLIENIQNSGATVSTQGTLTGEPVPYGGPSKLETLNAVIAEAKTPKQTEESAQETLEGIEDETREGTPAERGSDPDTQRAGGTGTRRPGPGDGRVTPDPGTDGQDTGDRGRGTDEQTPERTDGARGGRDDETPDARVPAAGDTPGRGTDIGEEPGGEGAVGDATTPVDDPGRSAGNVGLSPAERAEARMRARRGLGPRPETAPEEGAEERPLSAAERAEARMRARRGLEKKKSAATPEQRQLYEEFLGDLATEYAAEIQAQEEIDEFRTELLEALTAEEPTAEQQALYDEFLGDLATEYITDLQARETLDDFGTELLDALQAHVGETAEEGSVPEETPAEEPTPDSEPAEPPSDASEDIPEARGEDSEARHHDDRDRVTSEGDVESVPDSVPIAESHVSPLHEPTALASQNHPDVSDIELNISDTARGVVSAAQALAVKLMKRASEQFQSVEAQAEWMQGLSYRLGFLLGDGTGSGKTITGLTFILDQIAGGNKQHFIIGPKQDLFYNNYTADMKKLGGPVRSMFNFGELKTTATKKKGAGIGFSTYTNLTARPNLKKGKIGLRLSQFLHNLAGKRPPLEILNPDAHRVIGWLKQIGGGQFPSFEVLNTHYQGQPAEAQKALHASLPEVLQKILDQPKLYTQKKYAEILKIFQEFDNFDKKYKTATVDEFIAAASEFDGVILFDEAHSMRGDDSATRDVGLMIQRVAPNARVVYLSATPITKVEEIQYAERLGLWGQGTSFQTYQDFEKAFAGDDLTAKEVIAKDLKGYGRYLRRSLDMSGVEWENREHTLTDEEILHYDNYVQIMQKIKALLRQWAERQTHLETGRGKPGSELISRIMKRYYNEQQEFFNQLQTAFKTRALLPEIINQLKDGKKVAVQLSTTGEVYQKRAEVRAGEGNLPDLSLKNMLIDFLMSDTSPIYKYIPKGTGKNIVIETDANGKKVVHNSQSVRERDEAVKLIQGLPDIPGFPIDTLHQAVSDAGFTTAEITGRSHYYVNGNQKVQNPKNTESIERQFRETRDLNFIIISDAGGEGRNLQTMRTDSPLVDFDIETGWNVVNTIQKFGRFKRTGAAHDPVYILTQTDSPASKRIAGALALKLTDMGALATGQARSQMNLRPQQQAQQASEAAAAAGDKQASADSYILGNYGREAMRSLWRNFHAMAENPYIQTLMSEMGYVNKDGTPRFEEDANGNLKRESIPEPRQYLSRLFGVPYKRQAEYAELFFTQLDALLAAETEKGTLDVGTTQLKTRNARITRRHPLTVHQESGTTTDVIEVQGEQALQRNSWEVVEGIRNKQPGYEGLAGPFSRYVRNTKSGKIYALFLTTQQGGGETQTTARGITNYKRFGVRGKPDYINSTQLASANYETLYDSSVPEDERSQRLAEVKELWQEAEQTGETTRPLSRVMITGMLLPIWDQISVRIKDFGAKTTDELMDMLRAAGFRSFEEAERSMQIRQLLLADGTPIQGRIIPVQFLESLFGRFGIDVANTPFADMIHQDTAEAMPMDEVLESVSENKAFLTLDNGAIVSQVGDSLEIYGFFTDEEVTALGLTPAGEVVRGNELLYGADTEHSRRYNTQDAELARWELPAEKLPDLLGLIPPDTITERGDDARPLNVEGINKPDEADPHADPGNRMSRYRQFIKLRQLILPYAENISNNDNWERGMTHSLTGDVRTYLYYLDDVDKYVVLEFTQSRYGSNMTFSIENEIHDRKGSVQLSMPVPDGTYSSRAHGTPRFAFDLLNGNTENLSDHTYLDKETLKNLRLVRVRRELQKEANLKFKPSTDLERVDAAEFTNTSAHLKVGTLPDGQEIAIVAGTIKKSRTSAQWIVGVRIGTIPTGVKTHREYPKYVAYSLSAKDVDAAMDNAIRKLRGDSDILKGLSAMFSESNELEGVLNAYDNHQKVLAAEEEAERQRAADESEETAAPRIQRSGEAPGDPESQYALDHEAIASLETDVEKIVGTIGNTAIKRRILSIHAKIINGHQVNLVGQQVKSAHEVAILAQAFRNPLIEVYRTLYVKDGVIVAHDGFTLNSSAQTRVSTRVIRERIKEHNADGIYMLHNHPTSFAMLSQADISSDMSARSIFGNQYLGEIVVNSGTYAKLTFNEDGSWDHQDEIPLSPEDVGWDTTSARDPYGIRAEDPLYKGFTPEQVARFAAMYPTLDAHRAFTRPGISTQDPEYVNLLNSEEAPKAIAQLGNYLKTREGWTVIVGMSNTGYITLMTEFQGILQLAEEGKLKQFLYENMDTLGADMFHIITTGGRDVRQTLMSELGNSNNPTGLVNGVASMWVDGEAVGNVVPLPKVSSIPSQDIKEGRETEYVTQPPPQEETPESPEADDVRRTDDTQPGPGQSLQAAVLEAIEGGDWTDDGFRIDLEVEGYGNVHIEIIDDEDVQAATTLTLTPDDGDPIEIDIPRETGIGYYDGSLEIEDVVIDTLTADIASADTAETPDIEGEADADAEEQARRDAMEDMGDDFIEDDDEYWEKGKANPAAAPDPADTNAVISIMPNPDDFDQETRDNTEIQGALNTFTNPESGIRQILGLSTRQGSRITRKTLSSGFGALEEMSKTDRDGKDKIGDVVRKNVLRRQFIAKSQFARDATRLLPILKELESYVNSRATPTLTSKGNPQARSRRGVIRQSVNNSVWRFIEDNKAIKDPQLLEVAKKLKEAWREMLIEGTHTMLDLTSELKGVLKEDVFITDSAGNRVPWYPESFDGFIWDPDTRDFKRNEGNPAKNPNWVHYSIEEAHRKAERLYTPHYFKHNKLRSELRKVQQLIDTMNALLESDTPAADKNRLRAVGIVEAPQGFGGYIFEPDGTIKVEITEMLEYAADYWTQKELSMRGLLEYTDAGLRAERYGQVAPAGTVDGDARIGYYGHLERARETDDRFYERDLRLLLETRRLMWDRFGEIATIGQVHPILGTSPRLETVLEQVRAFRKNKREFALAAVAVALKAGDPKSMFERLPQFGVSVEQGLSVQQDWRVYTEDDKGKRVATDEYQELDIARMNLTDEVLQTLRTIGFITKTADGVDVVAGETIEDRQLTVARFFYEFYNTIAQREASVKDLYLSLGHWHTKDPLEVDDAKFWQKISDITTATTLSWTTAIQNLLEVPLTTELTGTRTMLQGLGKIFAKEPREQLLALAEGLSHAPKFMAESDLAEKYLGSWISGFTKTDKISRAIGLGVGLENAKKLITEYVTGDEKTKTRLRRTFDEMALDVKVIDTLAEAHHHDDSDRATSADRSGLDALLQETTDLILSGQVTPKFGDTATPTEKLAWTVLQHMHYISDQTFKAYDATSLPPFLMKQTPLIRLFMKYKSWMFQHNAFKLKNWRRAVREARAGNFRPMWNMAQSAAWAGVTYSMLLGIYAAASGYDDDDNSFIKGMHAAQTFGMSSVLLELAARADGNWWQLSRDMMGQAAGPVGSITSQTVAPMVTGDWNVAGSQVVRRIPVINVFKRMGGFRLLEENEE